uniref:Solute carrier family 66 member 1 like n=1 Tax=Callithrix jacchus TaxID=9483 RepID=A0A2R8MZP1_CALJA
MKVVGNNRANAANSSTDRSRGYLTCLRQLFVAYRNGRVDAAVSLGFLLCWIGGDLTNFKGCYLTKQLPIQIFTTVFDMNTDIIMRSQFMYYRLKNQKNKISKEDLLKELYFCCLHWP